MARCSPSQWPSTPSRRFARTGKNAVIGIDRAAWQQELQLHQELFQQLEHRLPAELKQTKAEIEKRLAA